MFFRRYAWLQVKQIVHFTTDKYTIACIYNATTKWYWVRLVVKNYGGIFLSFFFLYKQIQWRFLCNHKLSQINPTCLQHKYKIILNVLGRLIYLLFLLFLFSKIIQSFLSFLVSGWYVAFTLSGFHFKWPPGNSQMCCIYLQGLYRYWMYLAIWSLLFLLFSKIIQ